MCTKQQFHSRATTSIRLISIGLLSLVLWSGCDKKTIPKDLKLEHTFSQVDSAILNGESHKGQAAIDKIDTKTIRNQSQLISYYILSAILNKFDADKKIKSAEKALSIFDSPSIIDNEKELYFQALVVAGDAHYFSKSYLAALNYYVEAKNIFPTDDCKKSQLFSKFASIYFDQKNYGSAARYHLDSYRETKACETISTLKTSYYRPEMSINNAAFCFFKNNQLDSAAFYYDKFAMVSDSLEKNKIVTASYANILKAILLDNLAGLNLKKGNVEQAEVYLKQSLVLDVNTSEDIRIPAYIKLGEVYTKKRDNSAAISAFHEAKLLLKRFPLQRDRYYPLWQKKYADYFQSINQVDSAFYYQNKHINTTDSIAQTNQEIISIDIGQQMEMINQRLELNELRHNDQIRRVYVVGLIEFLVLGVIIVVIAYRNYRRLRNTHALTLDKNHTISVTLEELERANKNYIRIMRIMAHDLRNPLSGMAGLASALLYDDVFDDESKKMLKLIETTGMHSIEMINELLKTGLADEDAPIDVQQLDVKALLYDSVELLQFKAKEKQQTIIFDDSTNDDPIFTKVNYEKIWRVLNNLIINAIKFSLIGGVIKTGIKEYKASIVIYVEDNGVGIPEQDKDAIFDMFTEAKKVGTNGEQPFGLGLSISKKIMEKHGGKIWFENGEKGGTIFYVEFPKR